MKMKDVYIQNPALGDASSLDKQLEENGQKLDKLNQELQKFEVSDCCFGLFFTFFASPTFLLSSTYSFVSCEVTTSNTFAP